MSGPFGWLGKGDHASKRTDGYLPLESYGALGDGRSIALSGADGSIDWWCVPNIDSPPLFDRLLDAGRGGRFRLEPAEPFTVERAYRPRSNVLETTFNTHSGQVKLTESMNSGTAGRLPWAELARRLEGVRGAMRFRLEITFGRRGGTVNPYHAAVGPHTAFHIEKVLGLIVHTKGIDLCWTDEGITGEIEVRAGERRTLAIIAGRDEPLVVPSIDDVEERIDISDKEWRDWTDRLTYEGEGRDAFLRSALALKLLLFSPTGAIAAAATTSVPERIAGEKNYDYRYAWARDTGYAIRAFLAADAQAEAKSAFTWLINQLRQNGKRVCYTLEGNQVPDVEPIPLPGYRDARPVVTGNIAARQWQHGVYGDILETAACFVSSGNILDSGSAETLVQLADDCADRWRRPDAGMWELEEEQHYTMSKISCWQALARAVELADQGQLPTTCRERWARERDRVKAWIEENCWSDKEQAFVMYPSSDKIDAAVALAVRFGFDGADRLRLTLDAIDRKLGSGLFHYRYSGMQAKEGCFLACSFWLIEARAQLGDKQEANKRLAKLTQALNRGVGILSEMVDPHSGAFLGNLPQGLSHLAHIMTLSMLSQTDRG